MPLRRDLVITAGCSWLAVGLSLASGNCVFAGNGPVVGAATAAVKGPAVKGQAAKEPAKKVSTLKDSALKDPTPKDPALKDPTNEMDDDYVYPESSPSADLNATLEVVQSFPLMMPRGVAVGPDGRIFVSFPRHEKDGPYALAELKDGQVIPYPDAEINARNLNDVANHFVAVMASRVDTQNRLWVLDSGRVGRKTVAGGARLFAFDLATGKIVKTFIFDSEVLLPTSTLKDFRVDLQLGKEGVAIIADSSPKGKNSIIVVDLASGKAKRRLDGHYSVTAEPDYVVFAQGEMVRLRFDNDSRVDWTAGIAGLALSGDGKYLFYSPMAGLQIYRIPLAKLCDFAVSDTALDAYVQNVGHKIGSSDGLESDTAGSLYITDVENNMIWRRKADGSMEKLVRDDRLIWPDRLCLSTDGYLYIVASQFNKGPWFHFGEDQREKPYKLLRIKVGTQPVRLSPLPQNMDIHVESNKTAGISGSASNSAGKNGTKGSGAGGAPPIKKHAAASGPQKH